MKKILILTAVTVMTAGFAGCRLCNGLFRGAAVQTEPGAIAPMYCAPVDPCVPCDPCPPCGGAAPMVITPGPESYAPAPIR
jgi:hypothetical protein